MITFCPAPESGEWATVGVFYGRLGRQKEGCAMPSVVKDTVFRFPSLTVSWSDDVSCAGRCYGVSVPSRIFEFPSPEGYELARLSPVLLLVVDIPNFCCHCILEHILSWILADILSRILAEALGRLAAVQLGLGAHLKQCSFGLG